MSRDCDRYLLQVSDHFITTSVFLNNCAMSLHLIRLMIKANVSINLRLFGQRLPQDHQYKRNVILYIRNTSHLADYQVALLTSLDRVNDLICSSFSLRPSYRFFFFLEKKKHRPDCGVWFTIKNYNFAETTIRFQEYRGPRLGSSFLYEIKKKRIGTLKIVRFGEESGLWSVQIREFLLYLQMNQRWVHYLRVLPSSSPIMFTIFTRTALSVAFWNDKIYHK